MNKAKPTPINLSYKSDNASERLNSTSDSFVKQGRALLAASRKEAALIIRDATLSAEQIKSQAREEALREAKAEAQKIILAGIKYRNHFLRNCRNQLFDLINTICRQIIATELKTNAENVIQRINQTLSLIENDCKVIIEVNPENRKILLDKFQAISEAGRSIEIRENPNLNAGDAHFFAGDLHLISSVDSLLEQHIKCVKSHFCSDEAMGSNSGAII